MIALVFDTETTGLIDNHTIKLDQQPSVIEFYGAIVNCKTGRISQELDLLIKPPRPIDATITKITGLANDDLKDAPSFREIHDQIFKLIERAPLVIAHNLSFDQEIINLEAERLKYELHWPQLLCTVEQTIALVGYRLTLSALHQLLFNEPFAGAHRAKVDVQALIRICVELHKRDML